MLARLSPVITCVGGASPQPIIPCSLVIFTIMVSAVVTVREAVLNGVCKGICIWYVSIVCIFITTILQFTIVIFPGKHIPQYVGNQFIFYGNSIASAGLGTIPGVNVQFD